jgi:predicted alpha/beta superfamily hydrolase
LASRINDKEAMQMTSYPPATIFHSEARSLTSAIVDQEYAISVWLPPSYEESNRTYPALYVLDANICFGLAADVVISLIFGGEIPEIILVGVGYPIKSYRDWLTLRARDLTPTVMADVPGSGGADRFLSFLRTELSPFVESNYRADPTDPALAGYSYGGLFAQYTLLTQPNLFRRYMVSSPYVVWDDDYIVKLEAEYASHHRSLPATVFTSTGSLEEEAPSMKSFDDILRSRKYADFHQEFMVYDGETHLSVVAPAFMRGVKWIYASDIGK